MAEGLLLELLRRALPPESIASTAARLAEQTGLDQSAVERLLGGGPDAA